MASALFALAGVDVAAGPRERAPWDHVKDAVADAAWSVGTFGDSYARGMRLHGDGRYDEAIPAFEKSIQEGARVGASSYNIACCHARLGHDDLAFAWLLKAVDAGFDVSDYLYRDRDLASLRSDRRFAGFAELHGDRQQRDQLLARYDSLLSSKSKDADEWAGVALQLHLAGQHDRAAQAFTRALEIEPQTSTTLYNLACARALSGQRDSALDALELAVEAGWSDAEHVRHDTDLESLRTTERYRQLVADAELLGGSPRKGLLDWVTPGRDEDWAQVTRRRQAFVDAHPGSGAGWFQLGFAALRSGDPDSAAEAFTESRRLGHRKGTSAYNIACCHAVSGRVDQAFEWLERSRAEGFDVESHAGGDEDLASLRDDPRFATCERSGWRSLLGRMVEY